MTKVKQLLNATDTEVLSKVEDTLQKQKALENYQRYLDELPSKKQADEAKDVHRAIERLEMKLGRKGVKASSRR